MLGVSFWVLRNLVHSFWQLYSNLYPCHYVSLVVPQVDFKLLQFLLFSIFTRLVHIHLCSFVPFIFLTKIIAPLGAGETHGSQGTTCRSHFFLHHMALEVELLWAGLAANAFTCRATLPTVVMSFTEVFKCLQWEHPVSFEILIAGLA